MRTSRYEFWEEIIQPITMSLKLFSFFELLCQLSSLPRNTTVLKGRYNYYFYEVHHIHTCILQWQWKVTWGRHQRGAMGDNKQSRKKSAEHPSRSLVLFSLLILSETVLLIQMNAQVGVGNAVQLRPLTFSLDRLQRGKKYQKIDLLQRH